MTINYYFLYLYLIYIYKRKIKHVYKQVSREDVYANVMT